jgi:hypothetical protein
MKADEAEAAFAAPADAGSRYFTAAFFWLP